jgi:tetratricopeptide (TPR) repeat protein
MKISRSYFAFFLLNTALAFPQGEDTEKLFAEYLKSYSRNLADILANSETVYSYFCKAFLAKSPNESLHYITQFIEAKPKIGFSDALIRRGEMFTALQKYDSALVDLTEVIRLEPKSARAYYFRGETYAKMFSFNKAIDDFTQTLKISPTAYQALYYRGVCYSELGDYSKAKRDYDKGIDLKPDYGPFYLMRGILFVQTHKLKHARKDLELARKLNPGNEKLIDEWIRKTEQ